MDSRLQAEHIYEHAYTEGFGEKNEQFDGEILKLIGQYLKNVRPSDRFHYTEITDIIEKNSPESYFLPNKAESAFKRIETYLTQLVQFPWKIEFYTLREYCGFYQTKIESHLKGCETIFLLVGYIRIAPGVLRLKNFDAKLILSVAFECLVASVECSIMQTVFTQLKHLNVSPVHIVECRMANAGETSSIVKILKQKINQPEPTSRQLKDERYDKSSDIWSAQHKYQNQDHITSATEQFKNDIQSNTWMDGGFRVINQNVDSDEHIPNIDNINDHPGNEEAYEGTHDEHLQASLLLVKQDNSKSDFRNTTRSDEWSFVRRKLESDYGTEYFDGSRGDFLKEMQNQLMPSRVDEATTNRFIPAEIPALRVKNYLKNTVSGLSADVGYFSPSCTDTPISSSIQYQPDRKYMARSANANIQNQMVRPSAIPFSRDSEITDRNSANEKTINGCLADNLFSQNCQLGKKFSSNSAPIVSKKDYHIPKDASRPKSVSVEPGSWICAYCTVDNRFYDTVCAVCSKSREGVCNDHLYSNRQASKVCEICTLENKFDAKSCQACHSELNGIQTAV